MKCCDVKPGDLNRQIEFFDLGLADDGQGGQESTPIKVGNTSWAKIEPMKASEKIRNGMLNTQQMSKVMLRYRSDITQSMTATTRSIEYNIRSIVNIDERDEWLELMIEKVVAK